MGNPAGGAANRFPIIIAAVDQFSKIFQKATQSVVDLNKPIEDTKRGFKKLSSDPALPSISKDLKDVASSSKDALGGLAALVPSISTLAGIGSLAGLGEFASHWINNAAAIDRSSQILGMNAEALQTWQGALRMAGGSADAATGALQSLGQTMQGAAFGRDQNALAILSKLGIQLHRTRDGAVDVDAAMLDLSASFDATRRAFGIQAAENLVNQFGLGGLIPLLIKGQDGVIKLRDEWKRTGAVISQESLDNATSLYGKLAHLEGAAEGAGNALGGVLAPGLGKAADATSRLLETSSQLLNTLSQLPAKAYERPDSRRQIVGMVKASAGINAATTPGADLLVDLMTSAAELGQHIGEMIVGKQPEAKAPPAPAASAVPTPYGPRHDAENEVLRQQGANRAAFLRDQLSLPIEGKVDVSIRVTGAPPGSSAHVTQSGQVNATAQVETFMPTSGP